MFCLQRKKKETNPQRKINTPIVELFALRSYGVGMIIAYLFNRPKAVASDWDAGKVFIDAPGTMRLEREDMINNGGLRAGDTLVLAAMSDLGRGAEARSLAGLIERMGVTIEVRALDAIRVKKKSGRAAHMRPDPTQKRQICALWSSAIEQKHVLERAAKIMGVDAVTRNQMNRLCGPRHKPKEDL